MPVRRGAPVVPLIPAALTLATLALVWLARPLRVDPDLHVGVALGPAAWLVWGAWPVVSFAVASLLVLAVAAGTWRCWRRTRAWRALGAGLALAGAVWLVAAIAGVAGRGAVSRSVPGGQYQSR